MPSVAKTGSFHYEATKTSVKKDQTWLFSWPFSAVQLFSYGQTNGRQEYNFWQRGVDLRTLRK